MDTDEWEGLLRDAREEQIAFYASRGDLAPLIAHIEQGAEIGKVLRAFLADYLRGKVKGTGGNIPVKANRDRRLNIANEVWLIAKFGNEGKGLPLDKAQEEYLKRNPNMKPKTLETYCMEFGVTGESVRKQGA